MTVVFLKENDCFDTAMRKFKRAVEKTGRMAEVRMRECYEKPTTERKRKKAAAAKRWHKCICNKRPKPKLY